MKVLGLDLGGTNIKHAIVDVVDRVDDAVNIESVGSSPTRAEGGPGGVADRLIEIADVLRRDHSEVVAVGVGIPGTFDVSNGTVELFPNLPGPWLDFPLRDRLSEGMGCPVTLVNDARAFSLAESTIGAGRGCSTVVCVTLGTGVGGGLVIDGALHLGAWGRAGEIGHQTVKPDGPLCGCGNRGCAEPLVQAGTIARSAGTTTAQEAFDAAAAGDTKAIEAVETAAGWLGLAIANTVTVVGPDRIVIGGGMAEAGEILLEPIRRAVAGHVTLVPAAEIDIVAAELGPEAGAVGAALAAAGQLVRDL